MWKFVTMLMSGGASSAISAGASLGKVAIEGYTASQKAKTDTHAVDVKAATEIEIEAQRTNLRMMELNDVERRADRGDKRMAWVRPAFVALSFYCIGSRVLLYTQPKLAATLWIEVNSVAGDPIYDAIIYLMIGIPCAVFGLRPLEKKWWSNTITKAQETAAGAQIPKPSVFARLTNRRETQSGL